jgi:hypothetical protein
MPPAFNLSQDQTLQLAVQRSPEPGKAEPRGLIAKDVGVKYPTAFIENIRPRQGPGRVTGDVSARSRGGPNCSLAKVPRLTRASRRTRLRLRQRVFPGVPGPPKTKDAALSGRGKIAPRELPSSSRAQTSARFSPRPLFATPRTALRARKRTRRTATRFRNRGGREHKHRSLRRPPAHAPTIPSAEHPEARRRRRARRPHIVDQHDDARPRGPPPAPRLERVAHIPGPRRGAPRRRLPRPASPPQHGGDPDAQGPCDPAREHQGMIHPAVREPTTQRRRNRHHDRARVPQPKPLEAIDHPAPQHPPDRGPARPVPSVLAGHDRVPQHAPIPAQANRGVPPQPTPAARRAPARVDLTHANRPRAPWARRRLVLGQPAVAHERPARAEQAPLDRRPPTNTTSPP